MRESLGKQRAPDTNAFARRKRVSHSSNSQLPEHRDAQNSETNFENDPSCIQKFLLHVHGYSLLLKSSVSSSLNGPRRLNFSLTPACQGSSDVVPGSREQRLHCGRIFGFAYLRGSGVRQDAKQAVEWFRKAAKHGSAAAAGVVALAYEHGLGVPKDPTEAGNWYRTAGEQGIRAAQRMLSVIEPLLHEAGAGDFEGPGADSPTDMSSLAVGSAAYTNHQ